MSAAMDVLEHGTVQGYRDGCRGRGECEPSFLGTCADAMVRYRGDYAFKRAVDGGASLVELEQRDVAARQADAIAVREQNAAARAEGAKRRELIAEPVRVPAAKPKQARAARAPHVEVVPEPTPEPTPVDPARAATAAHDQARHEVVWALDHLQAAQAVVRMTDEAARIAREHLAQREQLHEAAVAALAALEKPTPTASFEVFKPTRAPARTPRTRVGKMPDHGTYARYQRDCKKGAPCPASPTCSEKANEYYREYRARRAAEAVAS